MLQTMRHHAKYFYVLFFIVILTFIFWGVGVDKSERTNEIVAEVGKYKITAVEYWRAHENAVKYYREIYKDKFDEEMQKKLKVQVIDSLVDNRLLLIAAEKNNIKISDDELSDAVMHEPAFFKDGVFNQEVYKNRLGFMNLTPDAYEAIKRKDLLVEKMSRLIELSAGTPENELTSVSGNEETMKAIKDAMANDAKQKVLKAYIEGMKKEIKVVVNSELIS